MKFYLIVAKGKKQGMPIPIEVDLFVVGSSPICQLRCQHPEVGEQHAAFVTRGRKVFVRDLNSDKATLVNDEMIPPGEEWPLHVGDRVKIGPLEFVIQFREKQLSQRDLEEWALRCLDEDAKREKKTALEELDEIASQTIGGNKEAAEAASAILDRLNAQRGVVRGHLRISRENGVTTVRINEVTLVEGPELQIINKELHDNLAVPNLRVLIDFKNVKRMSSEAATMFADLRNWLRQFGSTLAMCRLRPELQGMMESTMHGVRFFADKQTAQTARW